MWPPNRLDHVKRVEGWMTLAYHVYDSFYCKVMNIVICDMRFENTKAHMCNVVQSKQVDGQ